MSSFVVFYFWLYFGLLRKIGMVGGGCSEKLAGRKRLHAALRLCWGGAGLGVGG